ncbi:hypothetical protein I4U23_023548 [Adineta vaga]|nr:hypothetical protein I4U23_023548 [Adineta vaga]
MINSCNPLMSQAILQAVILLSQKYNITIEGQFIGWNLVVSEELAMDILGNTCLLLSTSNTVSIVGPSFPIESHVIIPFTSKLGIPAISDVSTDPELSDQNIYPSFYRITPSNNSAASAIAKITSGTKAISKAFNLYNLQVSNMIVYDIVTHRICSDFKRLLTNSPTRIIIIYVMLSMRTFLVLNWYGFQVPRFYRTDGLYYVARNMQQFSNEWIPPMETNTIVWSVQALVVRTGYARITGVPLRIAVVKTAPFIMTTEIRNKNSQITKKAIVYMPNIIDYLQKRMGFILTIIILSENTTYNGLIDALVNNVYDMLVAARREK